MGLQLKAEVCACDLLSPLLSVLHFAFGCMFYFFPLSHCIILFSYSSLFYFLQFTFLSVFCLFFCENESLDTLNFINEMPSEKVSMKILCAFRCLQVHRSSSLRVSILLASFQSSTQYQIEVLSGYDRAIFDFGDERRQSLPLKQEEMFIGVLFRT